MPQVRTSVPGPKKMGEAQHAIALKSGQQKARFRISPPTKIRYSDHTLMLKTIALACLLSGLPASAQAPDLILVHGKILTVDAKDSIAQAVAIRQGKIIAVGSNKKILQLAGSKARVIDLHGQNRNPRINRQPCPHRHWRSRRALLREPERCRNRGRSKTPGAGSGRQAKARRMANRRRLG